MKNIEKVMDALVKAFPGHRLDILFNFNEKKYSVYIDERYVGNFEEWFLRTDLDKQEIEIKVKAPLYKIKDFLEEVECDVDFYHAIERGFKEWEKESQRNS